MLFSRECPRWSRILAGRASRTVLACALLALSGAFATAVAGGAPVTERLVYRAAGSRGAPAERVALVLSTDWPLLAQVRVLRVDDDEFEVRLGQLNGLENLDKTEFLELAPGDHRLRVTVDARLRATLTNQPKYPISRPLELMVHVDAGKTYVLWGDVWADSAKAGLSPLDEFCVSDYPAQVEDAERITRAREQASTRVKEVWSARDQIREAALVPRRAKPGP